MEDGEAEVPDGDVAEHDDEDVSPETPPDVTASFRPAVDSTGWEINWAGAAALAAVVLVVLVGWGWLTGGSDDGLATADEPGATAATTPSTSARAVSTTTTTSTTTTMAPATTAPERRVIISGVIKPCRFGDRCLTASFVIEGFDEHPGQFACIYSNSLSAFEFNDNDVDDACLTGDAGDSITIEVAGVRSATISEDDLDGTG